MEAEINLHSIINMITPFQEVTIVSVQISIEFHRMIDSSPNMTIRKTFIQLLDWDNKVYLYTHQSTFFGSPQLGGSLQAQNFRTTPHKFPPKS